MEETIDRDFKEAWTPHIVRMGRTYDTAVQNHRLLICLMFRFRPLPGRFQRFAGLPSLNFVRFYKRMTTEAVIDKRIPDK